MALQQRIVVGSLVCRGRPHVRGTRIMVALVLDNLADGLTAEEITRSYPPLTVEDVRACLAYAAELARDEAHASYPRAERRREIDAAIAAAYTGAAHAMLAEVVDLIGPGQ
jgi:uncharacterized protein (DUF433 family)